MRRYAHKPPAYRLHKATGQARVRHDGRDHYLGPYGSAASKEAYARLIARIMAGEEVTAAKAATMAPTPPPLTVTELIARYWRHCLDYYRKDGATTREPYNIRAALRPVRKLYGEIPAAEFGPKRLKHVREEMIRLGWSRRYINQSVHRVRGMFRWGVSEELLPAPVFEALRSVRGLAKGRTAARERPPVEPVPDGVLDATLPHMPPTLADMVRVQRLTGMRPGELVALRGDRIDRSEEVWSYRPARWKTEHHGRHRVIFLGPKAQAILASYLLTAGDGYLFSPKRSEDARNAEKRAGRKTPMTPSHRARKRVRRPRKAPGACYTAQSYTQAIGYACARAFPHPTLASVPRKRLTDVQRRELLAWDQAHRWHANQVRHKAATEIRREFGLEASQVVLGHAELGVTQVYAERDMVKAREVMRQTGYADSCYTGSTGGLTGVDSGEA
jgi:integrase